MIAICKKSLGNKHPQVAIGLNNLATLLKAQVGLRFTDTVETLWLNLVTLGEVR